MAARFVEFASRRRYFLAAAALVCIAAPALLSQGRSESITSSIMTISSPLMDKFGGNKAHHDDEYLAVCLSVRDQAPDLPEWLQHHYYNMGVSKFYIMDDGSKPPMSDFIDSYGIPREALEFHYYDESQRVNYMQGKVYSDCSQVGKNSTWMAFIDADEFLDAPGPETVREVLKSFEPIRAIGAVGVSWRMHTSNGQLTRADSVLKTYTECIEDDDEHNNENSDNKHIKSIVRVKDFESMANPHKFNLKNNALTVGEYGDRVDHYAFRTPITRDRLSLHHYAVKSKEEYVQKINRGNAMTDPKGWEFWNHVEQEMAHVDCPEMARWVH